MSSLPAPNAAALLTEWSAQPLAILLAVGALTWWLNALLRLRRVGQHWPARRSLLFGVGLVALLWCTNGFPQAYSRSVFAAWLSQSLLLLLVVPALLVLAQPVALARAAFTDTNRLSRFIDGRVGRSLSSPFVGPAIVPVLCAVLFFGPVPGWEAQHVWVGWLLAPLLTGIGALIVLPLLSTEGDGRGSLAVGVALGVGLFELMIDAVPGIALRLQTNVSSTFFDHRVLHPWSVAALTDQQGAGAILWGAAELLDLPFLLLIFRRWVIADAADAAEIDTVLEAERISRAAARPDYDRSAQRERVAPEIIAGEADQPWWLHDPAMRDRLQRGQR